MCRGEVYIREMIYLICESESKKKNGTRKRLCKLCRLGFFFISIYLKYKIDTFNRYATDIGKNVVENV